MERLKEAMRVALSRREERSISDMVVPGAGEAEDSTPIE
jgi:hypothetical protein